MSTRIALKYCGGCDPEFDRVELFAKIRPAAADSIEWVGLDDHGFNTVLVIAGCARACPEQHPEIAPVSRYLPSARSPGRRRDRPSATQSRESNNEDQNQARLRREPAQAADKCLLHGRKGRRTAAHFRPSFRISTPPPRPTRWRWPRNSKTCSRPKVTSPATGSAASPTSISRSTI